MNECEKCSFEAALAVQTDLLKQVNARLDRANELLAAQSAAMTTATQETQRATRAVQSAKRRKK